MSCLLNKFVIKIFYFSANVFHLGKGARRLIRCEAACRGGGMRFVWVYWSFEQKLHIIRITVKGIVKFKITTAVD